MEGPSPTQAILEGLRGLKHEKWGWVIYRCTYADDKAWTRFKDIINKRSHEEIAEFDSPELANTLEWTYVEDCDTLDGISIPQLRTRFQAWAADAIRTENPRAEGLGLVNHGYPRYSYFIEIDEDALRRVVYEAPQPPAHDEVDIGHVKFVKAD
ncbi:hypothetical protein ASPWEDRAFT_33117 [Aspergillus wentii DTO 134E9]|uniref:Uncharacterized protein n=1 Tax=Aspergillus wentii DTO 134E9 TaxID=1073089 RepID=A0A1L9R4Q4_ASPWE|nr:uncharacterized protein ASPWEDRAFT_33117 [Aspergillus wentii DTO 134E9]KAI9927169.1 hypothetical protein MW887_003553 [Aspergillus wentii]OJJ29896.1 hypothetical protein ASPWEDRAFT_33117 [Aspergillus wentii DTO 134E9]